MRKHLVWDWNGTLLNDFSAVVAATNEVMTGIAGQILSPDEHRERFRRPIIDFYSELAGRTLAHQEFADLDQRFHQAYLTQLAQCRLTDDAEASIGAWSGTQSLLSLWSHDALVPLVETHGLTTRFARVDGLPAAGSGDSKHPHLIAHLDALGLDGTDCVMIGDSVDDALAAQAAGADCVLYAGGFTSAAKLRETGMPVVASLTEAVALARK